MDTSSDNNDSSSYNSLFLAIHDGKLNIARNFMEENCVTETMMHEEIVRPPIERDADGNTPLHLAVRENNSVVFNLLVEELNVNTKNNNAETPLHFAAANNRNEFAKSLLENGAFVNVKDAKGQTPLYLAVMKRNIQLAKLLLKNGSFLSEECCNELNELNELEQNSAIDLKIFESVEEFQIKRCNDEFNTALTSENHPLVLAVSFGHLEVVKYLMKNGFKYSAIIEKDGEILFNLCIKNDYLDMLKYFIDIGVKVRETVLHTAMAKSKYEIWKYLLTCSSKVNSETFSKETELHSAIRDGQVKRVEAILNNWEIDLNSLAGKLAIHIAVENCDENILKVLLNSGFSPEGCFERIKPIHIAATFNDTKIVELLLKAGVDINSLVVGNLTPLYFAAYALQPRVVKFLLENGADPHKVLRGFRKSTPLLRIFKMFSPSIYSTIAITPPMFENLRKITEMLTPRVMTKIDYELLSTVSGIRVSNGLKMKVRNSEFRPDILRCMFNYLSDEGVEQLSRMALNRNIVGSSPEFMHLLMEYDDSRSCKFIRAQTFENYECQLLVISYSTNIDYLMNVFPRSRVKTDNKQLLKLIVARLVLLTNNYYLIHLTNFPQYNTNSWRVKCIKQKSCMKETKVHDDFNITLYEVLTTSLNKLAMFTRNTNFLESLESSYDDFPAYAEFLRVRIEMSTRRNDLVDECANFMYNLIGKNYKIKISNSDIDQIFQYLSAVDLRRFSAACQC